MKMQFDWVKHGLIFDPTGHSDWMDSYAQVPTVLERGNEYRIFFACRPKPDEDGYFVSHTAYVDVDKQDLSKILRVGKSPILEMGCKGSFDEFGIHPTGLISIGDDVYLYYTGWSRGWGVPYETWIGLAISKDGGDTFQKVSEGPVLGKSIHDPFLANGAIVFREEENLKMIYASAHKWMMVNGKPEPVYTLKMATSSDGLNWSTNDRAILPPLGEDECVSRPAIWSLEGETYLWYGYRRAKDFRGGSNSYRIGMAISKDGTDWIRQDGAGLALSDSGWDSEMMSYPTVFTRDKKLILLYNGNDFGKNGFGYASTALSSY